MAFSYEEKTGNGSTHTYTFNFDYILKAHVKLFYTRDILLNTQAATLVLGTDYNFTADKSIQLIGSTLNSGTTAGQPYNLPNGTKLMIERQTPDSSQLSAWQDGSNLTAEALNNADLQNLYVVQETQDRQDLSAAKSETAKTTSETATTNVATLTASQVNKDGSVAMTGNLQLGTNRITGVGDPSGAQDASTKNYVDTRPGVTGEFNNTPISLNDDIKIGFGNTAASPDATIDWDTDGWFDRLQIESAGDIHFKVASGKNYTFFVDSALPLQIYDTYIGPRVDIKPYPSNAVDLGKSDAQWKDLYVDGTGYIDTVSADDITGNAIVTSGTSTSDTKVYSAKRCDELFYNLASAEEIQSGETWVAADNKVATTAAIDARIVDLVDDVGGFIPLASEQHFPLTNPDLGGGTGTLLSVPLTNSYTANAAGQISIPNGTLHTVGANLTVTIIGAEANATYASGFGLIVETESTGDTTYRFHRYVPKATEVTTVATNISNINTVANDLNETISEINTVADAINNVDTVATNIDNVNKVAAIDSDVTAVVGDAADIGVCSTNIGSIAVIGSNLAGNFENITDYGSITGTVSSTGGSSSITIVANNITDIDTVSGISANVTTVAGISANVTSVAGNATNINSAVSNASNINTCATNISAITDASTHATNAATSATSSASSASTSTAQAAIATTQATNAATSAATANAHQLSAKQYRDDTSGIKTQSESNVYNLSDSVSSHTAWGDITDVGTTHFSSESGNVLLTMSKGSSVYDYGAVA